MFGLRLLILAGLLAPLIACKKPEAPATPPSPRSVPAAADAPLQLSKPDEVRVRLDLDAARSAIRIHQQEHGAFPASLDVLSLKLNFPADLTYDAASGSVTSATYPRF